MIMVITGITIAIIPWDTQLPITNCLDTRTRRMTAPAMSMTGSADIPTARNPRSFPVPAAGDAASARS